MSYSPGDTVYVQGPNGPLEVTFVGKSGPDCIVEMHGALVPIECSLIRPSPNDLSGSKAPFLDGDRVAVRVLDAEFGPRVWPGTVRTMHKNGRVSVDMQGLSHPQTLDSESLIKL